ncbi:MAG: hypothetical protein CVV42_10215 [Candidatus Riflebacteria bacterium HGW-Riflebacteria-2]|jgi:sigma-B regulation protein RsbU (phosphoserine phosphatase)|nr:MAG: hypothetical protein CVV42_10215 [Candidatus Riflebacteria bacterium HGW-Riflebacteria-2]
MSSGTQLPLQHRWPIAFWSGVVLFFVLFPLFLLDVGLESLLETRQSLQKQELYRTLEQNLEKLLQYRNSRHYYHALLKTVFNLAEKQQNPEAYLNRALAHLKERNPGIFRFIVWNGKGEVIDKLTDEKGYRYIVKTLYEAFRDITSDSTANYPGNPELLPIIERRINILRSYLGAFLVPEFMNLPMLRASLGECIIASSDRDRSNFWFQIGKKIGLFAQISHDAIESAGYLEKLVTGINRSSTSGFKIGIIELTSANVMFTGSELRNSEEVLIELKKFQHFAEPRLETENYLILARMVSQSIMGFSLVEKRGQVINTGLVRGQIMAAAVVLVLLIAAAFYAFFKMTGLISIRYKLAILFIYANGLPLIILGFLGYEYLQQTRRLLIDQAHEKTASLLRDFDSRYELIKAEYAGNINRMVDEINRQYKGKPVQIAEQKELLEWINNTRPYDFVLINESGRFQSGYAGANRSGNFFGNMGRNLLEYINIASYSDPELFKDVQISKRDSAKDFLGTRKIVFHQFLRRVRKINPEQMGAEARQYYWNILGDAEQRRFTNILVVSWLHAILQESYVKKKIEDLNNNAGNIKCFAIVENSGVTYPEKHYPDQEIFNLFRQAFGLQMVRSDNLRIGDNEYAAFATIGRQLNQIAIVGLYPLNSINQQIDTLRARLIVFALLSLGLTLGIGKLLSAQFMQPVKHLEEGVQAIGRQDFRYRLKIASQDEFGHLGSVFNNAIESLEDLEVAKVVQENLFPLEDLKHNRIEVYGRSVTMSRLGGDYYDFFAINKQQVGVLMGDVAGHGVPAALLMAMAKASVLIADDEKTRPAQLLTSLHKVIYRIKSSKIRRMMTCQYFCIDSETGDYLFANAGHCFPAIISQGGQEVTLLQAIGSPLGVSKRAKYEDLSQKLNAGDIVLLYTDGIIEAQNSEGLEMGFDRFTTMLKDQYSNDLETYYRRIFAAYLNWSSKADDDITFVLIRFADTEAHT